MGNDRVTGMTVSEAFIMMNADHMFDTDNWEASYDKSCVDVLFDDLGFMRHDHIMTVGGFKLVPFKLHAAKVPISFDEDGEIEDEEVRLFPTKELAEAALKYRPNKES
jgi:hypothetical protein